MLVSNTSVVWEWQFRNLSFTQVTVTMEDLGRKNEEDEPGLTEEVLEEALVEEDWDWEVMERE